jgi:hypothetical protein
MGARGRTSAPDIHNHVRVDAIDSAGPKAGWQLRLCDGLTGVTRKSVRGWS